MHCTSTVAGYGGAAARASCLPHTGLNLAQIFVIAVALIAVGLVIRLKGRNASR